MKKGALDCASIYFAANLFHAMFFHHCPRNETEMSAKKKKNCFTPRTGLLNLRFFVAEVRWLLPVIPQKYRESTKQRNTEPS